VGGEGKEDGGKGEVGRGEKKGKEGKRMLKVFCVDQRIP